ncbi:MAG: hypothetical protein ACLR1V_09075 [Coprococcus sp.]
MILKPYQAAITDDVCIRRARHAVSENAQNDSGCGSAGESNDLDTDLVS